MRKTTWIAAFLGLTILYASCGERIKPYDIPTTYNFDNVSYSGQTDRLDMLEEMTTVMKTGNNGVTVDATVLKNMYANENDPFTDADLNASTKQIKSKTFLSDQTQFENWMDSLAAASQSTVAGSNGTAGVVVSSSDPTKQYLFDAKGVEYTQLIEKGLMGALIYYQITGVYLTDDKIGEAVDNITITPGAGTDMEHHWDEAFGYFGVPTDFPTNTTGIRFIGKYCNSRDALLETNSKIMDAYLAGRAAISNSDSESKNTQRDIIREQLEIVFAATAIHYLNEAKSNFSDDAIRNHTLSEAVAFLNSLKYNPVRNITTTQITTIEGYIGDNFYEVTIANIDQARNELSTIIGLDSVKDQL